MTEPFLSKVPGTDIYAVVGPDGRDIGFVRKFFRTIEKDIPGARYVAWRRTAKSPSWRHWLKGETEPGGGRYCISADTRKQAVDRLLRDHARAIEARRAGTAKTGPVEDESASA